MNNSPIGIFDSGVGGLSILREIKKILPNESFIFFADQKNVPYGGKTKEELISLSSRIVEFLLLKKVKLVVVACNTSTCYSIEELRKRFPIPIVGVVPAIKPAAGVTKTGKIALIATPATVQSQYVAELIKRFAIGIEVLKIGCEGLEDCVENGDFESKETAELMSKYIYPLKNKNIDQLVLGCTHYPFLKEKISKILGSSINLVDSGKAVALHVRGILKERNLLSNNLQLTNFFFTNKDESKFSKVASKFLGHLVVGERISI